MANFGYPKNNLESHPLVNKTIDVMNSKIEKLRKLQTENQFLRKEIESFKELFNTKMKEIKREQIFKQEKEKMNKTTVYYD